MRRSTLVCCVVAVVCGLGVGVAHGQLSDECTNPWLSGPALALCNAYCGALDCDGPEPNVPEQVCQRQLERFIEMTGSDPSCGTGGPQPQIPVCPCASNWWLLDEYPEPYDSLCIWYYYPPYTPDGEMTLEISASDGTYRSLYVYVERIPDGDPPIEGAGCWTDIGDGSGNQRLGMVSLGSYYPTLQPSVDESSRQFFWACWNDILAIADHFGVECEDATP